MSRKVCFLDFDGVLNSQAFRARCQRDGTPASGFGMLDPIAVGRLNVLHAATGCVYVISSTWREMATVEVLAERLTRVGFTGRIVGATPVLNARAGYHGRGQEIRAWLDIHGPVREFVILDDDDDMGLLADRLVQTEFEHGLTEGDVLRAVAVLSGEADALAVGLAATRRAT